MKKLSIFLMALVAVFALVACKGKDKPNKTTPEATTPDVTTPDVTTPADPADDVLANAEKSYHVVGGSTVWAAEDGNAMTAVSLNQVKALDAELAATLAGKDVKYLYMATGYPLAAIAGWAAKNNGEDIDGGFTIKVIRAVYDQEDGTYFNDQWCPDPRTAHVEALTDNVFMPKFVETPAEGEENLGTWADNPVVTSGDGLYTVVFAEYNSISTADVAGFGLAVIAENLVDVDAPLTNKDGKTYHAVGGLAGDWAVTDTNGMTALTFAELLEIDKNFAKEVLLNGFNADGSLKASVYVKEGYELRSANGWTTNVGPDEDGEQLSIDGGFTLKVIRAIYDSEDDVYFNDQWISDPKTAHLKAMTDNLFVPAWRETDEEGDLLGTWSDNPACIGHAGYYTVVLADFNVPSTPEQAGFAMGLYLEEEIYSTGELIQQEYDALVKYNEEKKAYDEAEDKTGLTEPTPVEHTEWTFTGTIVDMTATKYNEQYGNYNVRMVVDVDGVLVGIYDGQENGAYITNIDGLEVGKQVTVTGVIAEKYTLTSGDYTVDIEFSKPELSWLKVGSPAGVYVKGSMNEWSNNPDYELVIGEDGNPTITVELAEGAEFKVADANWSDSCNYGYVDSLPAAFADNGGNILVVTAGTYVITVTSEGLVIAAQ